MKPQLEYTHAFFWYLLGNKNILITLRNKILSQFGTWNVQSHITVKPSNFIQSSADLSHPKNDLLPGKKKSLTSNFLTPFLSLFSAAISDIPRLRAHRGKSEGSRKAATWLALDWLHGYDLIAPESLILLWSSCEALSLFIQRFPLISHLQSPWHRQINF